MSKNQHSENKYNIIDSTHSMVRKSNEFTRGKYATSTAFALQLVNIAATRINEEKDGTLSATLSPGELREIFHTNDRASLYKKLAKASDDIMGSSATNNIFMEDGNGNFKYFAFITNADYKDGIFKITFNKEMKNHMVNLRGSQGYTTYALTNILDMKSPYSIRLYEILRSEIYRAGANDIVRKEYWVSELRFSIGLDELTSKMRDAKEKGATWDEVAEMIKGEQKYPGWRNFKRYVLDKAKNELTNYADVTFDYDLGRGGIGGRIERVIFYIRRNEAEELKKHQREVIIEQVNKRHQHTIYGSQVELDDLQLPAELRDFIGHMELTGKDLMTFLNDAEGNVQKVLIYIKEAEKKPYLDNPVGWIRDAIRGNYEFHPTIYGDTQKAKQINNLKTEIEKEQSNPESDTFIRLWQKTKEKEDYSDFLTYLETISLSEEVIEEFYSTKDRVQAFVDWKKGGFPFK